MKQADQSLTVELRRLFTEMIGTFALTLAAAGGEVIATVSKGEVSPAARAVAHGLVVMAFIHAIGNVSVAHVNPAVTLGFALRGAFPWKQVPGCRAAAAPMGFIERFRPGAVEGNATA